jgi:hypothetical protein
MLRCSERLFSFGELLLLLFITMEYIYIFCGDFWIVNGKNIECAVGNMEMGMHSWLIGRHCRQRTGRNNLGSRSAKFPNRVPGYSAFHIPYGWRSDRRAPYVLLRRTGNPRTNSNMLRLVLHLLPETSWGRHRARRAHDGRSWRGDAHCRYRRAIAWIGT